MARKSDIEPIIIEDELPMAVSHAAEVPSETVNAIANQKAQVAPTMEQVLAYWTPGRERTMEVPQLIAEYSVKCEKCDQMLPYIPEAFAEAPKLVCASH
jgi:hypothetical protein